MFNFKEKIEDYTEEEFIEFLGEFIKPTAMKNGKALKGKELDKYWDIVLDH
ncbi:bacteriocin immunity protein, partial [Salmonella enterica subsp. salamae]|nr:bacteriocin immunity protein [Salmonella enterica subsp. salamae]